MSCSLSSVGRRSQANLTGRPCPFLFPTPPPACPPRAVPHKHRDPSEVWRLWSPPSVCLHPDPPFLGSHEKIPATHRQRIIWGCVLLPLFSCCPSPTTSVRLMMEATDDTGASEPHHQTTMPRPRITNACEACRSAKVKCQASNQLGICRRYVA